MRESVYSDIIYIAHVSSCPRRDESTHDIVILGFLDYFFLVLDPYTKAILYNRQKGYEKKQWGCNDDSLEGAQKPQRRLYVLRMKRRIQVFKNLVQHHENLRRQRGCTQDIEVGQKDACHFN
jgi:hypothetical protein